MESFRKSVKTGKKTETSSSSPSSEPLKRYFSSPGLKVLIASGGILIAILLVWFILSQLFLRRVDPGNAGILIQYATNGKPQITTIPTGNYVWINPFGGQLLVEYPTAQQSLVMVAKPGEGEVQGDDSIECQDQLGIPVKNDVTVLWRVDPAHVDTLYLLKPGVPLIGSFNGDIESTIVRRATINAVTSACSSYQWDNMNAKRAQMVQDIKKTLIPSLAQSGVLVSDVYLGEVHYSDQQQQALNDRAMAQQKAQQAQYLAQQAKYEADAAIAKAKGDADAAVAKAKGDADAIRILNEQLQKSPLYIQYAIVQKWDGKLPAYLSTDGKGNLIFVPFDKQP